MDEGPPEVFLTDTQHRVLMMACSGEYTNDEICERLCISSTTLRSRLDAAYNRFVRVLPRIRGRRDKRHRIAVALLAGEVIVVVCPGRKRLHDRVIDRQRNR